MKKLLFLAIAFVAGLTAISQQKADDIIKVNSEKYNFGKIKQGVPVTTYFTVTNISDKPVVIENAWAGCGCTTPEISKEPIAPGASAKLKVGYNAANAAPFNKDVYLKLAGIQEPKNIKITGEVLTAAAYEEYVKSDDFKKDEKERLAQEAKDTKEPKKAVKKA
ncbi:MAG: DUF1573 domain-containing protein [Flavisolibacter sp.]|jgi:hypothetical protein